MGIRTVVVVAALTMGLGVISAQAQEPALPAGLGAPMPTEPMPTEPMPTEPMPTDPMGAEPALPAGLTGPEGPAADGPAPAGAALLDGLPFRLDGYLEGRVGGRTAEDETQRRLSILETRLQLEAERYFADPGLTLKFTSDFLYDDLEDQTPVDLERGDGFVDLREAFVQFSPAAFADIKAGRQILTWGTGDLVFINDLFPKDFRAFFVGRDEEYLKAPSDALKVSVFAGIANLDLVYTPRFDADRFVDGRRLSFFDPATNQIVGGHGEPVARYDQPDGWFRDDEWAARLYQTVAGYELAAYGYYGFWKNPAGSDPATGRGRFPALGVYGASARGTVLAGIGHLELGFYDSAEDRDGDDPFIRNSELRALVGYEQEVAPDLTMGVQYGVEHMIGHDAYRATLPAGQRPRDETRHLLTNRITWLTDDQTVAWSLFTFFSPSDRDAYLRPHVSWKVTDAWRLEAGANLFTGRNDETFFGQLENNSNVYAGVRVGF